MVFVAGRHEAGGADHGKGGVVEGVLRLGEAFGCALLQTETLQFGTILHRLTEQFVDPVRHGRWNRLFVQNKRRFVRQSYGSRQVCFGGLQVALCLNEQQLGIGQVDVRKADVEARFQFAFRQRRNLVRYRLAGSHGLVGHLQHCLRAQDGEIGTAGIQKDLRTRSFRDLILCGGL